MKVGESVRSFADPTIAIIDSRSATKRGVAAPYVEQRGWQGLRRTFVDLFGDRDPDLLVQDLVTGHTGPGLQSHGGTRLKTQNRVGERQAD